MQRDVVVHLNWSRSLRAPTRGDGVCRK